MVFIHKNGPRYCQQNIKFSTIYLPTNLGRISPKAFVNVIFGQYEYMLKGHVYTMVWNHDHENVESPQNTSKGHPMEIQ
jgi:hypothetical protein